VTLVVKGQTSTNLNVELRDAADGLVAAGATGSTNVDRFVYNAGPLAAGPYLARVTGGANLDYALVVLRDAVFDVEPNNTFTTARPFDGTSGALGAITATTDEDWYSITLPAGTVPLPIPVPGAGPGQPVNTLQPRIQLFNPDGSPGPISDTGLLVFNVTTPGVYRIRVTGLNGTTGEYFLDPTFTPTSAAAGVGTAAALTAPAARFPARPAGAGGRFRGATGARPVGGGALGGRPGGPGGRAGGRDPGGGAGLHGLDRPGGRREPATAGVRRKGCRRRRPGHAGGRLPGRP